MSDHINNASDERITSHDMVVGVFNTPDQAEQTVQQLIEAGVTPEHISVIARDFETKNQVTGFLTTGDVARGMAGTGAWVGGLFGLLAGGTAMLWAPVVGPLVVLGPLVTTALGALQGGVVGGLMGAILGKGLEKERILKYERDVQAGKLLVVVHGTPEELEKVRTIMNASDGEDVAIYQEQAA
jgi:uncharacterized membrane protein